MRFSLAILIGLLPFSGPAQEPVGDDLKAHWSLQPVVQPEVPGNQGTTFINPIDAFINAKLVARGLSMSPPADPQTLMRRMSLDLTGLPPSPERVANFTKAYQQAPAPAVESLIDGLLASPRYGERWAQHWLDVIRWAETVGFETNLERPNAWHYRDWVIKALNSNMPYNRFLFEQIAGDTEGADAALGFLVAGPANLPGQIGRDEAAMRGARQDELDEVIRTVSQGILGLTVGCARCHDHKFDPIPQHDYYAMQAIFAGLSYGNRRQRGAENDAWTAKVPGVQEQLAKSRAVLEELRVKHGLQKALENVHSENFEPVLAKAVRMKIAATAGGSASLYEFEAWTAANGDEPSINVALTSNSGKPSASSFALANQTRHFDNLVDGTVDKRQAFPWVSAQGGPAWIRIDFEEPARLERLAWHRGSSTPVDYLIEVLPPDADDEALRWQTIAHTRKRLPRIDDTRTAEGVTLTDVSPEDTKHLLAVTGAIRGMEAELARLSAGPQIYAAKFTDNPTATFVLDRGDAMQRRGEVHPAVPGVLGKLDLPPGAPEKERRLAFARHLTSPDHPLTARVIVNRVWHHHFGTGLVETPSDFGTMGAVPSHPELLDWLASRFVTRDDWYLKELHRQIMSSQTYLQSSRPRGDALTIDADSRLLWRFPPRRLEAEAIRDSILSVSGKLNPMMGGRGFDLFNQRGGLSDYTARETFDGHGWRRMIYAHKVRMISVDIFGAFDCPDGGQMKPRRTRSITPVQSLGLFNSPFTNRQAGFFAERLRKETFEDPGAQVDRAFALAFSRIPTAEERAHLNALATEHGLEQVCRVIFNSSEFLYLR